MKLKSSEAKSLTDLTRKIDSEIDNLTIQKEELRKTINDVDPLLMEFSRLSDLHDEAAGRLQQIKVNEGEYDTLVENKKDILKQIGKMEEKLKQEDTLTQILLTAYSYISETKPEDCPICKQRIQPKTVLEKLEAQRTTSEELQLSKKKEIDDLKRKNQELEALLHKWNAIQKEIDSLNEKMSSKMQRLQQITRIENISPKKAAEVIKESRCKLQEIESKIQKNELEKNKIEQEIREIRERNRAIKNLEDNLIELIQNTRSEISDLPEDLANTHIKELESRIAELQKTKPVDSLREETEKIGIVIDYLLKKGDAERNYERKSKIDESIDEISYKVVKLDDLENSLHTIRDAISERQTELTEKSLGEFQASIDQYYGELSPHPVFNKIRILPLPDGPVKYDLLAYAENRELESHVNTRFSTAQANATALALFFAINSKLAEDFPLLILDDPTQNMDQSYQSTLIDVLKKVATNRQIIVATHEIQFANKLARETKSEIKLLPPQ